MLATVIRQNHMYCVVLVKEVVAKYSSPANAKAHRDAINTAISNPPNLNQSPKDREKNYVRPTH